MNVFAELVRFTVAFILLTAVVGKIRRPSVFTTAVRDLEVLPPRLAGLASKGFVALEALLTVALLLRVAPAPALAGAAGLFVLFAAIGWFALKHRAEADCGCLGGALALRFNGVMVTANLVVAAAAVASALAWDPGALGVGDTSVLASAGILGALCYWVLSYAESVRKLGEETSRLLQAR